jgi:hypothetical protein
MSKLNGEVYCAIRHNLDSGVEWMDLNSVNFLTGGAVQHANYIDGFMPDYAKQNPVKRFVKCSITEIEEVDRDYERVS